jgi:hypothetical protein
VRPWGHSAEVLAALRALDRAPRPAGAQ